MWQNRDQQLNKTKRFRSLLVVALILGYALGTGSYASAQKVVPPTTPAAITPPAAAQKLRFLLVRPGGIGKSPRISSAPIQTRSNPLPNRYPSAARPGRAPRIAASFGRRR
jgi:hypothetical protein